MMGAMDKSGFADTEQLTLRLGGQSKQLSFNRRGTFK
jgi:hypothetical protein